jgi:allophanate hydrolase
MKSLALADLSAAYREGRATPVQTIEDLLARIDEFADRAIWISRVPRERVLEQARALGALDPASLPLYGIPFAIKDNIDLAGMPTTAACPAFAYTPDQSAFVVDRLIAAGAVPIGKTNLDQFATGLVGTRSPYGACRNSFDPAYISGGSSSGSAVSVALGLVSFSLGTDTAGSGRVPAAFNNLIGFKPSRGRLSTRGVVPACRTLDVVSIFALSAQDAARVSRIAEGFDAADPYSRRAPARCAPATSGGPFRFGLPRSQQLEFFGNTEFARLFDAAVARLQNLGGQPVEIDLEPFSEAARLLYEGPWVAERFLVIESLLRSNPAAIHPVTRGIIEGGARLTAADTFRAQYRLQALRRACEQVWGQIDVLVTPTAGTIYRIAEVEADPVRLNNHLGLYTNFANLLDLAAVSVPAGFAAGPRPFGISLVGPAWNDYELLALAARMQRDAPTGQGALGLTLPAETGFEWGSASPDSDTSVAPAAVTLAVCGAHMDGLALNPELRRLGATLLERTHTAARYRLYALPGGPPHRPGLVRVERDGEAIEVELWSLSAAAFGAFVAQIPAPLGIGKIQLPDDRRVSGFVCESYAVRDAVDITQHGGWRAYLASRS